MRDPDLFENFERIRRQMDELFGDVFERTRMARRGPGFSPKVDVAYASDPPMVVVTAELAGIDADQLDLEIQGRKLILSGQRGPAEVEGDIYQLVEIERGPFRRIVELGVEVDPAAARATYEDGMLRVELPLAAPDPNRRAVRIEPGREP